MVAAAANPSPMPAQKAPAFDPAAAQGNINAYNFWAPIASSSGGDRYSNGLIDAAANMVYQLGLQGQMNPDNFQLAYDSGNQAGAMQWAASFLHQNDPTNYPQPPVLTLNQQESAYNALQQGGINQQTVSGALNAGIPVSAISAYATSTNPNFFAEAIAPSRWYGNAGSQIAGSLQGMYNNLPPALQAQTMNPLDTYITQVGQGKTYSSTYQGFTNPAEIEYGILGGFLNQPALLNARGGTQVDVTTLPNYNQSMSAYGNAQGQAIQKWQSLNSGNDNQALAMIAGIVASFFLGPEMMAFAQGLGATGMAAGAIAGSLTAAGSTALSDVVGGTSLDNVGQALLTGAVGGTLTPTLTQAGVPPSIAGAVTNGVLSAAKGQDPLQGVISGLATGAIGTAVGATSGPSTTPDTGSSTPTPDASTSAPTVPPTPPPDASGTPSPLPATDPNISTGSGPVDAPAAPAEPPATTPDAAPPTTPPDAGSAAPAAPPDAGSAAPSAPPDTGPPSVTPPPDVTPPPVTPPTDPGALPTDATATPAQTGALPDASLLPDPTTVPNVGLAAAPGTGFLDSPIAPATDPNTIAPQAQPPAADTGALQTITDPNASPDPSKLIGKVIGAIGSIAGQSGTNAPTSGTASTGGTTSVNPLSKQMDPSGMAAASNTNSAANGALGFMMSPTGVLKSTGLTSTQPTATASAKKVAPNQQGIQPISYYDFGTNVNPAAVLGALPSAQPAANAQAFRRGGHAVWGPGGGQEDKIPAVLSDGEYIMDAEVVSALGGGSSHEGARLLDEFRKQVRARARSAPIDKIPPKPKSPLEYLRDAKKELKKHG